MEERKYSKTRGLFFIGRLAVNEGFLTEEQLEKILDIQTSLQEMGYQERFGNICVQMGYLSPQEVDFLLNLQREAKQELNHLYGKIALSNGLINPDQLEECLTLQHQENRTIPIGRYLLSKKYMTWQGHQSVLKAIERLQSQDHSPETKEEIPSLEEDKERENKLYGDLAVRKGLVTSQQVEAFFQGQRQDRNFQYTRLSKYLLENNLISYHKHYSILVQLEKEKKIHPSSENESLQTQDFPIPSLTREIFFQRLAERKYSFQKVDISFFEEDELSLAAYNRLAKELQKTLDEYEILELAGRGGMALVFKAIHKASDQIVALKVLPPIRQSEGVLPEEFLRDERREQRFLREAKMLKLIDHQNVVKIYEIDKREGIVYYSMEYLEGVTLIGLLEEAHHIEEKWALEMALGMGRALGALDKQGLVHRDIKPENILINTRGEVKLFDFGLAKKYPSKDTRDDLTQENIILGTPVYMSPEQARLNSSTPLDIRSDIYSLGVVLFFMATGEMPFFNKSPMLILMDKIKKDAPSAQTVNPELSPFSAGLMDKMLARNPEDRFPNAAELVQVIEEVILKLSL